MVTDKEHAEVMRETMLCANSWVSDARVLGNVRADQLGAACSRAIELLDPPHSAASVSDAERIHCNAVAMKPGNFATFDACAETLMEERAPLLAKLEAVRAKCEKPDGLCNEFDHDAGVPVVLVSSLRAILEGES